MNPYHERKLFYPYHLERANKILDEEIPAPSTVEIDVTDQGCNQACVHCCFGSSPSNKIRSIDVDTLLTFLEEVYSCGTRAFELVGGGEPTTHKQIAEIIKRIKALGGSDDPVHIGLVTNGVLLDRILPVANHLEWVRVSLDSANASTYGQLHGVSPVSKHFEKVSSNINGLLERVGSEVVRLAYLVVPPINHHGAEIREAVAFAKECGVKHIAFRPAFLSYKTEAKHWHEAASTINQLKTVYGGDFVLGGGGGSWNYVLGQTPQPTGACRTRPLVMVIKADGTVPSCILFRERLSERPPLGHISEGLNGVWFSRRHRESLNKVDRRDCPDVCKHFRADDSLELLERSMREGLKLPTITDRIDNPNFI